MIDADTIESPTSFSRFREVIAAWASLADFASDLSTADDPVEYEKVKGWHRRDSIPSEYFTRVVSAAAVRGIASITCDLLSDLAALRAEKRSAG